MPDTTTIRTIAQQVLGRPEVLEISERPTPVAGPSQVLLRVVGTSLNPTDWVHRRIAGFLGEGAKVLGWDVSGVVEQVGTGVTIHQVGDTVFGMLPYPHGHGAAAEFVVAPARAVVAVPHGVDLATAGAVPLVGLTAWQALVDTAHVARGQCVLIHAAAGGVGHMAVQIAKALGAYVIGTASAHNHELVRTLGADEVIDYNTTDIGDAVRDIDVVLDTVGGDTAAQSLRVVRHGATIVSLSLNSTEPLGSAADDKGVAHRLMLVESDHEGMTQLAQLMAKGLLAPVIDREIDLFDIGAVRRAHSHGENGHVAGKILLRTTSRSN